MPSHDEAAARSSRLLTINESAADADALQCTPYRALALRALILLSVLFLTVIDWLPFYVDLRGRLWDRLLDLKDAYDTPVGIIAGTLTFSIVLVALAGAHAPIQHVLHRPELCCHAVNVLVLVLVVPWWWQDSDADASDLFDGWGYISGKACKLMMGLCLLPIARKSLWLNAAAAGFPEGIPFHRVTGWWCVAQVVIHSVCYPLSEALDTMSDYRDYKYHLAHLAHGNQTAHQNQIVHNQTWHHNRTRGPSSPGEFDGTEWHAVWAALKVYFWPWAARLNTRTGAPEVNTTAVFILLGLTGTLGAVALAAFSVPRLRRTRYDLFYLVHVPAAALFIIMGAVHDWAMMVFIIPGLFSYFMDRTDFANRTASSRFHRVTARVRVMTDAWVRVDIAASQFGGIGVKSDAAFGTHFMYLRVPALGNEAHAFSLAARTLSVVIKASGDWTRRLHTLAQHQAADALLGTAVAPDGIDRVEEHDDGPPMGRLSRVTTDLVCEVDGVYGNAAPPWRSYSHVLFVGGGVGVAPWLPAIEEHVEVGRVHGVTAQTMGLVWVGRTHEELEAMAPYLPEDTTVFLTRTASVRGQTSVRVPGGSAVAVDAQLGGAQDIVGKSGTQPWLFAWVGVASLVLTQMAYHYFRGAHSVYVDYEQGCGECIYRSSNPCRAQKHADLVSRARPLRNTGCFEGEPTLMQYLLAKALPVSCGFVAIAAATIFGRCASQVLASFKCPCAVASGVGARGAADTSTGVQSVILPMWPRSVKYGRPNMAELIEKVVAEVEARPAPDPAASSLTAGVYVCVCGPAAMIKSCKDGVRHTRRQHQCVPIGLHVEEPDW